MDVQNAMAVLESVLSGGKVTVAVVVIATCVAAHLLFGKRSRLPPMARLDPFLPAIVSHTWRILFAPRPAAYKSIESALEQGGGAFQMRTILGKATFLTGTAALRWAFRNDTAALQGACLPPHWNALLGYHSLPVLVGAPHKRMRRIWASIFTPATLARAAPMILHTAESSLAALADASAAAASPAFPFVKTFALDVILVTLLGVDSRSHERFATIARDTVDFLDGLAALVPLDLPFTAYGRAMAGRRRILDAFRPFVRERLAAAAPPCNDVLQMFMDARDDDGQPLSEPEILDSMLLFIFAGHDTSTVSACSALHIIGNLAPRQAVDALREELSRTLPRGRGLETASECDALLAAPYLEAFLKELFRVVSPIQFFPRRVMQDVELCCPFRGRSSTFSFRRGETVALDYWFQKHNADNYPRPESFEPERFLPGREEDKAAPFTLLPFGGGMRMCVGMPLAKLELKLFLAVLVRDYDVEVESFREESFPMMCFKPTVRLLRRAAT